MILVEPLLTLDQAPGFPARCAIQSHQWPVRTRRGEPCALFRPRRRVLFRAFQAGRIHPRFSKNLVKVGVAEHEAHPERGSEPLCRDMSVGRVHSLIVALTWFIYNSMYESAELYEGGLPSQVTVLRSSITMACMSSVLLTNDGNEGDNQPTIRCQLAAGHYGKHRRSFTKSGKHGMQGEVVIEWDNNIDDSEDPDEHETGGEG